MRRQLNQEEKISALHMFYVDGRDLGTIAKDLNCTVYDLSPWITEVGTRIILGLPERNHDLQAITKLLADMDHVSSVTAQVNPNSGIANLLDRAAKTIRSLAIDHEINQNFLHIADIRLRQANDLLYKVGHQYHQGDLKETIEEVIQFLADDTPTNTTDYTYTDGVATDYTYTDGVATDGAAILKD